LLVSARKPLPVGSTVSLEIRAEDRAPLKVQGEVVRSTRVAAKGSEYELGVRLVGDSARARNLLLFPHEATAP
jgi:hypothetical protein